MAETSVPGTVQARLLLIGTEAELGRQMAPVLDSEFLASPIVVELQSGRPALDVLRGSSFDVVMADLGSLRDLAEGAEDRIARLVRAASGSLVVVLAADASISFALSAMNAGAHDCVGRDWDAEALVGRMAALARRHGKMRAMVRPVTPIAAAQTAEPEAAAPIIPAMRDLVLPMWRQEQRIIEDAIQRFAGNIALAAAALELSPSTIYRKRQAWAEMGDKRTA